MPFLKAGTAQCKQAQGCCLSMQTVLTFFPFFLALPVFEVCGGGPVVQGLATLLVVCAFRLL